MQLYPRYRPKQARPARVGGPRCNLCERIPGVPTHCAWNSPFPRRLRAEAGRAGPDSVENPFPPEEYITPHPRARHAAVGATGTTATGHRTAGCSPESCHVSLCSRLRDESRGWYDEAARRTIIPALFPKGPFRGPPTRPFVGVSGEDALTWSGNRCGRGATETHRCLANALAGQRRTAPGASPHRQQPGIHDPLPSMVAVGRLLPRRGMPFVHSLTSAVPCSSLLGELHGHGWCRAGIRFAHNAIRVQAPPPATVVKQS